MRFPLRAAAAAATLLCFLTTTAGSAMDGSGVIASAYGRNASLNSFTFRMSVEMAMHHFPWLHFHMDGTGHYERGKRYDVEFDNAPVLAPGMQRVDLSTLAPSLWSRKYRVSVKELRGDDTIFKLTPRRADTMREALVAVSPTGGTRSVEMHYSDGTNITLNVNTSNASGYLVPVEAQATIDSPRMPLSADATFSDYSFVTKTGLVGTPLAPH